MRRLLPLLAIAVAAAHAQVRTVESVIPSLAYGPACTSTIHLRNLSERGVIVDVEGHKPSGALVPMAGHPEISVHLAPREESVLKLQLEEPVETAWVKVRERVPAPTLAPVIAVSGATECVLGDRLRTVSRDVVYPTASPWFSGDVTTLRGGVLSLINTSERAVRATLCYSSGTLYSTPESPQLTPVCSSSFAVQVPPFGAQQFPVDRDGSTHFELKTQGAAIVLQMLRPLEPNVKMYKVDSTIQFGGEVPTRK